MITFTIAVAVLSGVAAVLILQRAAVAVRRPDVDPTLAVYRRQLGEIDDLAERGLLPGGELRAAKTEAARRLLAAAETRSATTAGAKPSRAVRLTVLAGAVAAPLLAAALYMALGSPGAADQPFKSRLARWINADPHGLTAGEMAAVLQAVAQKRPGEAEPLVYLARAQADSGAVAAAAETLRKAIRLEPRNGGLWSDLGVLLLMQGQGEETPPADDAFRRAAALDPTDAPARYHLARARIASGDLQGGLADWKRLAADLPDGSPQRQPLEDEIVATAAAGRLAPPPARQQAAQGAPPAAGADGRAFVNAMVARLQDRLRRQPDDPAGWARLIRSYAVLGEADEMNAALARARTLFKGRQDALNLVDNAMSAPQGQE